MDESVSRSAERTADEAGHHRTMVIILAVAALVLMAAAWLLAAPAAGALARRRVLLIRHAWHGSPRGERAAAGPRRAGRQPPAGGLYSGA